MREYEQGLRSQTARYVAAVYRAHPELRGEVQEPEVQGPPEVRVIALCPDNIPELLAIVEDELRSRPKGLAKLIIKTVARKHSVEARDLISHKREKRLIPARNEAYYEVRENTPLSTTQIGHLFGDRDHSTIIYGIRKHEALLRGGRYDKTRNNVYPWGGRAREISQG